MYSATSLKSLNRLRGDCAADAAVTQCATPQVYARQVQMPSVPLPLEAGTPLVGIDIV